jgi:hypothetical protein
MALDTTPSASRMQRLTEKFGEHFGRIGIGGL